MGERVGYEASAIRGSATNGDEITFLGRPTA